MTIINTSPNKLIQIGYEGEDKVTILRFSYSDKWLENGEGIFTVRVLRNGENQAYNAQLIEDDRENYTIDMTVTDVELSIQGYGEMQLVYTGADFVKKSPVYKYYVSRSVDDAVDPPAQDVYTQIIESLSELSESIGDIHADIRQMDGDISDLSERIGYLSALTTEDKSSLVSAINEVNEHGGGTVTVDDALSVTSTNPVQNKVVTSAVQSKADIQTVSALADAVQDLDGDVQGLQTAMQSKADKTTATTSADGLMSSADKSKLDAVGSVVTVSGTSPVITAVSGVRYVCGEVATLDFTPCATGICDVVFTSGSTPTVVTLPNTVKFPDGSFTAEANKTYEINVMNGVYGVVMAWT